MTSEEKRRAAALQASIAFLGSDAVSSDAVIDVAVKFEDYIENGKSYYRAGWR